MDDYKDAMLQVKRPSVSRCLNELYDQTNMDDIDYSGDIDFWQPKLKYNDISKRSYKAR